MGEFFLDAFCLCVKLIKIPSPHVDNNPHEMPSPHVGHSKKPNTCIFTRTKNPA